MVGGCGGGVEQWWFCGVGWCRVGVFRDRVVGFCALGGGGGGGSMGVPVPGVHFWLDYRGPKWFMCLQISTHNSGYRLRIHGTGSSGTR